MKPVRRDFLKELPKPELHCHLDGSLRIDTILDLAQKNKVDIGTSDRDELIKAVVVKGRVKNLEEYIDKFQITLSVLQTPEALKRAAFELAEDAAAENVRLLEVRYSPILHQDQGMTPMESLDAVIAGLHDAERAFNIKTGVIICGIRNFSIESSILLAELAVAYKYRGVVGYDLAGAEENFPAKDHLKAFYLTRNNNVNVTLHAGEAYGPASIHQAIHYCGANRIGHGTRLREDGDLMNYINDHRICLEICLTSNVQTGSIDKIENHPIGFYHNYGLRVTLNTDNRLISGTTLVDEYMLAHKTFNFNMEDFKDFIISGFKSAFLEHRERTKLIKEVAHQIDDYLGESGKKY
ncbi:MAG: adenosine deaminase [Candidatus Marinimicrobia bacterium]|nr:adenosine deaminase [Candidatus Neomarinimicrobiota bacterium]